MRVLRVAQKVYPDVRGGGPYHVHAMSRDQAAMGHDVTVLTVRQDDSLPRTEERAGYSVVRYDPTATVLGNDISHGVAKFLLDVDAFDVVHAHSHLYFSTNLAALHRWMGDVPLAVTNHGLYSQNAPEWLFELYLRSVGRWTLDQADVVFCYTDTDRRRLRTFGVSSRIEVVSNGIDVERFTPTGPESDLIESDGPVVLFVGRLVDGKRPGDAVAAVNRLARSRPDVALVFCGDGPLRESLATDADARIEFLGSVPYETMPRVYRSADVLVLPSRTEGTPRTVMESLASGVPVVCSDLPQVRAAFGDAVRYAPCGNVTAIADRIDEALASDRGPTLDDRFRWDRTVRETTTLLERIATESTGPEDRRDGRVPTKSVSDRSPRSRY